MELQISLLTQTNNDLLQIEHITRKYGFFSHSLFTELGAFPFLHALQICQSVQVLRLRPLIHLEW